MSASTRHFGIDLPPLRERFDRYEITGRVIRALFSEAAAAAPGRDAGRGPRRLSGATMEPAPIVPGGPPLWLGGQGPRGLRIAARYADGWNFASNLDGSPRFRRSRDGLLRACEATGATRES